MKNLKSSLLLFGLLFCLVSCSNQKEDIEPVTEIPCETGCLFTKKNATGKMIFMSCFQKFAIESAHPDDETITTWGIPADLDEAYKVEGKEVTFSAVYRTNTLQLVIADPSFDMEYIFEMDIVSLK